MKLLYIAGAAIGFVTSLGACKFLYTIPDERIGRSSLMATSWILIVLSVWALGTSRRKKETP